MLSNRKLDEYYSCPPEYVAMGALSEVVLYGTKTYFEKIYVHLQFLPFKWSYTIAK